MVISSFCFISDLRTATQFLCYDEARAVKGESWVGFTSSLSSCPNHSVSHTQGGGRWKEPTSTIVPYSDSVFAMDPSCYYNTQPGSQHFDSFLGYFECTFKKLY